MQRILLIIMVTLVWPSVGQAQTTEEKNTKLRERIEELERKVKTLKAANAAIIRDIEDRNDQIEKLGGKPEALPQPPATPSFDDPPKPDEDEDTPPSPEQGFQPPDSVGGAGWSERLFGGSRWATRGTKILDVKVDNDVLVVSHTGKVDKDLIFFTHEKDVLVAKADFQIVAKISGTGEVGLLRQSGQLSGRMRVNVDSQKPVTIVIKRSGDKISFLVNGKSEQPKSGKDAHDTDQYVFALGLGRDQTLRIHELRIQTGK